MRENRTYGLMRGQEGVEPSCSTLPGTKRNANLRDLRELRNCNELNNHLLRRWVERIGQSPLGAMVMERTNQSHEFDFPPFYLPPLDILRIVLLLPHLRQLYLQNILVTKNDYPNRVSVLI